MRKAEAQGINAAQMVTAVAVGGLLALGVELLMLLAGSAAVSNGVLREEAAPQLTAAACVLGCLAGGLAACSQWRSRRLLAGLATGGVCYLLIVAVGLPMGDGFTFGLQALIELAGCLCGGAIAGLLSGGKGKKKHGAVRKK